MCVASFKKSNKKSFSILTKKKYVTFQTKKIPQFKIFKKELHLPSPFAKTGDLFWPDFPKFRYFGYQGGVNPKDWSK